ncbi:MAG: arsenate reductase family protein [Hydrogenimonas sp.]|nr:arsenate reductase family protein [Hydrogenimonas sp.]
MKLYGIKSCDSVRKALKFLKSAEIDFQFVDIKSESVECETIEKWLKQVSIDKLFNSRGTTYRKLGLKNLNLDEEAKREWLCREKMLIKRPVAELEDGRVVVGFDEKTYKEIFNEQHSA